MVLQDYRYISFHASPSQSLTRPPPVTYFDHFSCNDAGAVLTENFQASRLKYAACDVTDAWRLLVESAPAEEAGLVRGGALELDLVDVTRQALSDYAQPLYSRWRKAVERRDVAAAEKAQRTFLALADDVDGVLGTHAHFSFARWLEGAAALAANSSSSGVGGAEEAALYAYNARNLLTLWGPTGQVSASRLPLQHFMRILLTVRLNSLSPQNINFADWADPRLCVADVVRPHPHLLPPALGARHERHS